jgi:hypothetical protein
MNHGQYIEKNEEKNHIHQQTKFQRPGHLDAASTSLVFRTAPTLPVSYTNRPRWPLTSSRTSSNLAPPGRRSMLTTSNDTLFLKTRAVLCSVRKM